ncbi:MULTISPECIES: class I SAM-dependent methyltransferase [Pontibacillus]|uniref:Class I SAM-dependent methyltransferase n=1 Tax=Pontibacillus chungwhensis TaxID=265426 RepID=A0ABY8UTF1_9BACI|nr:MULTISPECIES: class I SAM-dependent methyltransferase [Pontibacillus]MCD5323206.1 class I SAM-dependent methyltransferase [Pontibacillus sp. HN14]WIF96593.1 class I SAM-dependent methyltransferase [Pontibacillus chungwhensis]
MIDFHDESNMYTYTDRNAHDQWLQQMEGIIDGRVVDKAADIGCGGGIYSEALLKLGVGSVTGIDYSHSMIKGASEKGNYNEQALQFVQGKATETGENTNSFDLVIERALIHHLENLVPAFHEANRILKDEGLFVVQDRTLDDCFLQGNQHHLRGFLFTLFPRLKSIEENRRYESEFVKKALMRAGFHSIQETTLWEQRKRYETKEEFYGEVRLRKGRSILYELSDEEIEQYISYIDKRIDKEAYIVDQDRWTIWWAIKKGEGA